MHRPRLRSPLTSISRSNNQVSIRDEMATSVRSSAAPPLVRLVKKPVIWFTFRKSMRRISIVWTCVSFPPMTKAFSGSTATTEGLKVLITLCIVVRWVSKPANVGRVA